MKSLLKFIPTHILVFYCAGVLFEYHARLEISIYCVFGLSVFLLFLLCLEKYYSVVFCLLIFSMGILSLKLREPKPQLSMGVDKLERFVVYDVLKENKYSKKYIVLSKNNEKILVRIKKDSLAPSMIVGDVFVCYPETTTIPNKKNPYDFDYKEYLEGKNIQKQMILKSGIWKKIAADEVSLKRIAFKLRQKLMFSLRKRIKNKDVLSVTLALLLGERQYISSELQHDYANAGVVHILAVSGLHIGIIVFFLHLLLSPLKKIGYGNSIEFVLLFVFLWCYAFLAGLSASIIRAVTMFSFISFGMLIGRNSNVFHSLTTSALVLVLFNPYYLFDLGFKMSYIAVFSIIIFEPLISSLWKPKKKIMMYMWKLSSVSISAQIGLLPLCLFYFHQFPGLFILSNLVILPTLGVILSFGFFVLFLSYLEVDSYWCYEVYSKILEVLNIFVKFISKQEAWLIDQIYFSKLMLLASYIVLFFLIRLIFNLKLIKIFQLGGAILVFQFVLFYELYRVGSTKEFIVFQEYKKTIISIRKGKSVAFFGKGVDKGNNYVKSYINKTGVQHYSFIELVPSTLLIKDKIMLVIDSKGIYKIPNVEIEYLLLKDSPKINLDRCIEFLKPKYIIADGSSYSNLKERWMRSCKKMEVEFYDTSQNGAFYIK